MQRIRSQGLREERVVYDFGKVAQTVQPVQPPKVEVEKQTKIIK